MAPWLEVRRIGEAANPGPGDSTEDTTYSNCATTAALGIMPNGSSQDPGDDWLAHELDKSDDAFWIVAHNVSSLYAAAERHTATKAHVYAWQEAEVPR